MSPLQLTPHACAGGDDDAFYSPRSNASFTSDASFSSAADGFARSPSGDLDGEGDREARPHAPILARVRALEERIPGLQAKLHAGRERASAAPGDSLVARVEALEEAVDALLHAQEAQLEDHTRKRRCSPCCTLM